MKRKGNPEGYPPEEIEEDPFCFGDEDDLPEMNNDKSEDGSESSGSKDVGVAEPVQKNEDLMYIYRSDIEKYKRLSREEEAELALKARAGDREARETLINSSQWLLLKMANSKKYSSRGVSPEDLVAAGNEGLSAAIDKFDPSVGTRLSTFAKLPIEREMQRTIYEMGDVIRLPEYVHLRMARITATEEEYKAEHGKYPGVEELSRLCGIKEDDVRTILFYKSLPYEYLDESVGKDDERSEKDCIRDEEDGHIALATEEIIKKYLSKLDEKERRVIIGYYGLFGNRREDLAKLAEEFGLSKSRISQMRKTAEKKLEKSGMLDELRNLY